MTDHPSFELERFAWTTPDRLAVAGTFSGLDGAEAASPSLVVRTNGGERELPAVPDSVSGTASDGQRWTATFAWQEAPVPFDAARLELGDGHRVELPMPGGKRLLRRQRLAVQRPDGDRPAPVSDGPAAAPPSDLGLQAQVIAAEERMREAQLAAEQARTDLARAHEDLEAERQGRHADAERFRQVLEAYRASAEEALSAERDAASRLGSDLREAHEALAAKDEELERLREQASSTEEARTELEEARERARAAFAETESLRGDLENARGEADAARSELAGLRRELENARGQAEASRGEVEGAHAALREARADAERLIARLAAGVGGDRSKSP